MQNDCKNDMLINGNYQYHKWEKGWMGMGHTNKLGLELEIIYQVVLEKLDWYNTSKTWQMMLHYMIGVKNYHW